MPAHSLQRSQYVNGLSEIAKDHREALFKATGNLVKETYGLNGSDNTGGIPWQPYNFHAGNYICEKTGYSPQDDTTREMLEANMTPMPTWVFSPMFTLDQLKGWTKRQIGL